MVFDEGGKLFVLELLGGVTGGMGKAVFPVGVFVGERDVAAVFAAAAFPLVLGDVDGDAIKIGGELGFAAEAGQSAEEAEKDILGEIFKVGLLEVWAGKAGKRSKDHDFMGFDDLLEGGWIVQG